MISRIRPILIKELRQIARDKLTLGVLLFIPVFMLIMFGYALNFDVKNISIGIFDGDGNGTSRQFVRKFTTSEYFKLTREASSSKEIDELIQKGTISVGLVIPRDFSKNIEKGITASIQILVDGSNSNTASTVLGYSNSIIASYSKDILVRETTLKLNTGISEMIDYRPRVWYNPELKSAKFLIPGLISFILMITTIITISLSIVREKERNTMEQIAVSPVKSSELIIGKAAAYILISLVIAFLIFVAGYFLFDIRIKGSLFLLFVSILIFLTACLGLGLLISTVADTQQIAFMMSVIISMLPSFILSGFVFPIKNMPFVIQIFTYMIPARYFLTILRNIVLKGSGLSAFWGEMAAMIIMSAVLLGVSIARMRKKTI
jgi:ABC-2 type transport system permease protein